MVQGTCSHAGKSIITAALCRILSDKGISVAPFKAQNMALNSCIAVDGGEIGRAQVLQAEAARCVPTVDMNPILIKPTGERSAQVIVHGRVHSTMSAAEYHAFKKQAAGFVMESYLRLSAQYDVIVIEGAGSPAEINLRENDIANMGMAELSDSPVILVGDIDRGGVFASIVGTMELLSEAERRRVKGFVINKFRGDLSLLEPGLDFLEERTGVPVLGVVPYVRELNLPDEDGLSLERSGRATVNRRDKVLRIVVPRLPRISNFTDFDALSLEPDVSVEYVETPAALEGADMVVLPGTKNTIEDLLWLREKGFEPELRRFVDGGGMVSGICGGFQMLGRRIQDPFGVESPLGEVRGFALLDVETVLEKDKKTFRIRGRTMGPAGVHEVDGYEIHMGKTRGTARPFATITRRGRRTVSEYDGAVSEGAPVWGTYIHGIFDNDGFRAALLNGLRRKKGLPPGRPVSFSESKERAISTLARAVEESVDMERLFGMIGLHAGI